MSLNIKNEETHRLARELADVTGETMSAAVTVAVRERLDRIRRSGTDNLVEELLAISQDIAARLPASARGIDHGTLLYGDDGLPR